MIKADIKSAFKGGRFDVSITSEAPVVLIQGPSGSGKSTVLKILAGLIHGKDNAVFFSGTTWQNGSTFVPPWQRRIGYLPQDSLLFPHLNVMDNVRYGKYARTDYFEVCRLLEVEHLLNRYPRHLSGGEKQRVALARALVCEVDLLLLDEPFAALDIELKQRLSLRISELLLQRKTRAVIVSHDEHVTQLQEQRFEIRQGILLN